jgi:hypothetical protein
MEHMVIAVLVFILVIGPLALLYGRDSRIDDSSRRRRYLG